MVATNTDSHVVVVNHVLQCSSIKYRLCGRIVILRLAAAERRIIDSNEGIVWAQNNWLRSLFLN